MKDCPSWQWCMVDRSGSGQQVAKRTEIRGRDEDAEIVPYFGRTKAQEGRDHARNGSDWVGSLCNDQAGFIAKGTAKTAVGPLWDISLNDCFD